MEVTSQAISTEVKLMVQVKSDKLTVLDILETLSKELSKVKESCM